MSAISKDVGLFLTVSKNMPIEWINATGRNWGLKILEEHGVISSLNFVESLERGSELRSHFIYGFSDSLAAGDWKNNYSVLKDFAEMADSPEIATRAKEFFSLTASYNDPVIYIDWLDSNTMMMNEKSHLKNVVISAWAHEDIISYTNWVNSLDADHRTDDLVLKVVSGVRHTDPISALMWTSQISDENIRNSLAADIYRISNSKDEIDLMIENDNFPDGMFDK